MVGRSPIAELCGSPTDVVFVVGSKCGVTLLGLVEVSKSLELLVLVFFELCDCGRPTEVGPVEEFKRVGTL